MPEPEKTPQNGEQDGDNKGTPKTLQVGDKVYTPEQIQALEQTAQKASLVESLADKYKVQPDKVLTYAERAFEIVNELSNDEIISFDEEGNLIKKKEVKKEGTPPGHLPGNLPPGVTPPATPPTGLSEERVVELVSQALGPVTERLEAAEMHQGSLMRQNIESRIQAAHDGTELAKADFDAIFARAMQDKRKSLFEHAADVVNELKEKEKATRKRYAEQFGINLEEFDENQVRMSQGGGGAAAVVAGKKISFKKGEGRVTPLQATLKFLEQKASTGG